MHYKCCGIIIDSIIEDRRMLSKSKNHLNSLVKNKDVSLHHLRTLNSFLEGQQSQTHYINKEIIKEVELAKKNQDIMKKAIQKINADAQSLASRYEEEKERNEKLVFLVKHIETEIMNAKTEKANDLKENIETDKLIELTGVLSQKEKELEKICEKSNTQSYQLTKKIDTIRALRSERTIFSTLFDKLQRQLCNLQHCYKVLVIENKLQNMKLQEKIEEFQYYQSSGNKQLERVLTRRNQPNSTEKQSEVRLIFNNCQISNSKQSHATTPQTHLFVLSDTKKRPSCNKQENDKDRTQRQRYKNLKYENTLQKLAIQKKVKIIMNELGISSTKEIPDSLQQLFKINQQLLQENQIIYKSINKMEQKLKSIAKNKKQKAIHSNKKTQVQKKLASIKECINQTKKGKLELFQFKGVCKIFLNQIQQNQHQELQKFEFLNEEEEIVYYMGQLEKCMEKSYAQVGINCLQKPKKQRLENKRLTSFLVSNYIQKNNLSIFQEKDLLDLAKKDMQKLNRLYLIQSHRLRKQ